jgi:hypothetical protein
MFTLMQVIDSSDDVEPMSYANCTRTHCKFHVIIKVVSCLSSVVSFLEIEMCPLFCYLITYANVGLHRAIWVLLLNEIDSNC